MIPWKLPFQSCISVYHTLAKKKKILASLFCGQLTSKRWINEEMYAPCHFNLPKVHLSFCFMLCCHINKQEPSVTSTSKVGYRPVPNRSEENDPGLRRGPWNQIAEIEQPGGWTSLSHLWLDRLFNSLLFFFAAVIRIVTLHFTYKCMYSPLVGEEICDNPKSCLTTQTQLQRGLYPYLCRLNLIYTNRRQS